MVSEMKLSELRKYLRPFHYRVLIICACCLFAASVLFPFLSIKYSRGFDTNYQEIYWSHKVNVKMFYVPANSRSDVTIWFTAYWFNVNKSPTLSDLGIPWVSWSLMIMFLMQMLTLGSSIIALFLYGKRISFLPLGFCLAVIVLMRFGVIQHPNFRYLGIELGFWLSIVSAILFLFTFLIRPEKE